MQLLSIQIGQPQTLYTPDPNVTARGKADEHDATWESSIFKHPVAGPIHVGKTALESDGQADLKNHGGPDNAICVYAHEHYAYWQQKLGLDAMSYGAFGENFTTEGLLETAVCIGDTWAVCAPDAHDNASQVIVQISSPRSPCWKLARRWQVADLAEQVQDTGYTGWYFRVLQTGNVTAGDALHLLDRPNPQLTIAEVIRVLYHDKEDWEAITTLLAAPQLSQSWKSSLRRRINLHAPKAIADRIYGRTQ